MLTILAQTPDLPSIVVEKYGPIAFGVVALVVIWKVIVGPEMQKTRDASVATTNELKSIASTVKTAADTMATTSQSLSAVVGRLEELQRKESAS